MAEPDNVYVGRRGRVFIDGQIFCYEQSPFHNPFKVVDGVCSVNDSLCLFEEYLGHNPKIVDRFLVELRGKSLGCFCLPDAPCHAKVLARYVNSVNEC